MGFKINDIIIDRVILGVAESISSGDMLYSLSNLSDLTIETTAEKKEKKDANGTLVKAFYQGKAASVSCANAFLNLAVHAAQSGTEVNVASSSNKINMPKIILIGATTDEIELPGLIEGTLQVNAIDGTGTIDTTKKFTLATGLEAADTTKYGYLAPSGGNAKIKLPTDTEVKRYIVKYEREVQSGVMVENLADKFPNSVKLTFKCLGVGPCDKDIPRAYYIVIPSFQVSPETSTQFNTDSTFDFKGDAEASYCEVNKQLYYICAAEDDVEDDE